MLNIHASLVALDNKGILLLGKSGCGKSDLALRLIMEKGAKLVADDRVDLLFPMKNFSEQRLKILLENWK